MSGNMSGSGQDDSSDDSNSDYAIDQGNQEGMATAVGSAGNGGGGGQYDASVQVCRPPTERPVYKLTAKLIDTYKHINTVYYAAKALKATQNRQRNRMGVQNDGFDDNAYDLILVADELFNNRYVLKSKIGKGSFGFCISAFDRIKGTDVAIKIIKSKKPFYFQAQTEIAILEELSLNDPEDTRHCVRLTDKFIHHNHQCLVFEILSSNLYELLKKTKMIGVSLGLVKKFSRQLLSTLEYLASPQIDIIHCDLKPENILLQFPRRSAIKLIDFGSSCKYGKRAYTYIVSRFYRAPEILLGLPYSHKIDMWSLACVLVELHTGEPIFGGHDQVDQMGRIITNLGMPPIAMIDASPQAVRCLFFEKVQFKNQAECFQFMETCPSFRVVSTDQMYGYYFIKSREEASKGNEFSSSINTESLFNILKAANTKRRQSDLQSSEESNIEFIEFINSILVYDPGLRASPVVAAGHPFIALGGGSGGSDMQDRPSGSPYSHASSLQPEYPDPSSSSLLSHPPRLIAGAMVGGGGGGSGLPLLLPLPPSAVEQLGSMPMEYLQPENESPTLTYLEFKTGIHGQYLNRIVYTPYNFASEDYGGSATGTVSKMALDGERSVGGSGGGVGAPYQTTSTSSLTTSSINAETTTSSSSAAAMETSNTDEGGSLSVASGGGGGGGTGVSSNSSSSGTTSSGSPRSRGTGTGRYRSKSAPRNTISSLYGNDSTNPNGGGGGGINSNLLGSGGFDTSNNSSNNSSISHQSINSNKQLLQSPLIQQQQQQQQFNKGISLPPLSMSHSSSYAPSLSHQSNLQAPSVSNIFASPGAAAVHSIHLPAHHSHHAPSSGESSTVWGGGGSNNKGNSSLINMNIAASASVDTNSAGTYSHHQGHQRDTNSNNSSNMEEE